VLGEGLQVVKREREERSGAVVRDTTFSGGEEDTIFQVLKVPRRCPLVLVEVMHVIGIIFYLTLEGLHCSEF
jgi:hypothetical protein